MGDFHPDIVVGIDFGMTSTAVSWSMGPEWTEPRAILRWPTIAGYDLQERVDSCICYDIATRAPTRLWGLLCNPDDERFEFNALFKLNIDPEYTDPIEDAPSCEEAQTWYRDYLGCLYRYLKLHFSDNIPRFAQKKVESVDDLDIHVAAS